MKIRKKKKVRTNNYLGADFAIQGEEGNQESLHLSLTIVLSIVVRSKRDTTHEEAITFDERITANSECTSTQRPFTSVTVDWPRYLSFYLLDSSKNRSL